MVTVHLAYILEKLCLKSMPDFSVPGLADFLWQILKKSTREFWQIYKKVTTEFL